MASHNDRLREVILVMLDVSGWLKDARVRDLSSMTKDTVVRDV